MITGKMFRDGVISASNNIANNSHLVDMLNVFPVPDGDTGTNMSLTIGAAAKEMESFNDGCKLSEVSQACASALLRGARGNSGVILSLIFRGFATAFKDATDADGKLVAKALESAVQSAYKAVMKPTEGTILTVIKQASLDAREIADMANDPIEVCAAAIAGAREALEKTPELLPVLKTAGVVDAGGRGLVFVMEGFESVFGGKGIIKSKEKKEEKSEESPKEIVAEAEGDIKYGYCSEFLVEKNEKSTPDDAVKLRAYLESIGDCVVVVDDNDIIKVHVHSNEPGNVIQEALKYGGLINIKIDNMRYQHRNAGLGTSKTKAQSLPKAAAENEYGFVAVAAGDGLTELFHDIGVDMVVSGGQTMNPSTEDILDAIEATPAKNVFVLPNNKNIIMAAEQAVPLVSGKKAYVLQTKSVCQGISAMLAFDESEAVEDNLSNMNSSSENVLTAQITFAARDSEVGDNSVTKGEIIGMAEGEMKFAGDDRVEVALNTVKSLFDKDLHSLITIIYGEDANEEEASEIEKGLKEEFGGGIDISIVPGGQPIYYYYISVE